MPAKIDIKDFGKTQLVSWLAEKNVRSFRAGQILRWVYQRQADTFEQMTDLGRPLRDLLTAHFEIGRLTVVDQAVSQDGSRKFLSRLADGNLIESVLIPERDHFTLCISTQVGCAQGCRFCRTAKGGFVRNLTRSEIVAQVRDAHQAVDAGRFGNSRLTNIVLMGMGEPLANFDPVVGALETITDADIGLKFSVRRVTLSTAGLADRLGDLAAATHVNLAVSLNAADNATRSRLMPINRKYPIETLLAACRAFHTRPGHRITFEYILIQGVNDAPEDAQRLADLLRPLKAKINLIPFNAHPASEFKRPAEAAIERFFKILYDRNFTVITRYSKGLDIAAACGQLRAGHRPERTGKGQG